MRKVLRQPVEDHLVTISRDAGSLSFPANFMFIEAMSRLQSTTLLVVSTLG